MARITVSLAVVFLTTSTVVIAQGQQPPLLRETVAVTSDEHPPVFTKTPDEELDRLREADAIAVIEIRSLPVELSSLRDGAKVRGIVTDGVKVSPRAALWAADGTIEFEFDSGDKRRPLNSREYPLLKTGERYLFFFQLHPAMTRWYPTIPFRVDEAGRLEQVVWVQGQQSGWKSPIDGMPLSEVVKALRK